MQLRIYVSFGTSLVAQWLRIRLPLQGTQVRSLVQEDLTCRRATRPTCHNYWTCTLKIAVDLRASSRACKPQLLNPACHNYWAHVSQLLKPVSSRAHVPQLLSPHAATTEARMPKACALQQEKPLWWESCTPQWRVAPAHRN